MTFHGVMSRSATSRERVTVTLCPESVAWADRKARELGISRSELIDGLLASAQRREIAEQMAEGYRAMAKENRTLAEEGMESFREVIGDDPAWSVAPEHTDAAG